MKLRCVGRFWRPGIGLILVGLLAAACGGGGGAGLLPTSGGGDLPNNGIVDIARSQSSGANSLCDETAAMFNAKAAIRDNPAFDKTKCDFTVAGATPASGDAPQAAKAQGAGDGGGNAGEADAASFTVAETPLEDVLVPEKTDWQNIAMDTSEKKRKIAEQEEDAKQSDYYARRNAISAGDFEFIPNDGGVGDFGDIGADAAYRRGYDGSGVIVGVVSADGFQGAMEHSDLAGQFVAGYGVEDTNLFRNDHGTGIASIIAGKKDDHGMHGVAPGAKISPILTKAGFGEAAREYSGARILNFAWHAKIEARWTSFYAEDPDRGRNGLDPDGERDAEENPELYSRWRACGTTWAQARNKCAGLDIYRAESPLIPFVDRPAYEQEFVDDVVRAGQLHVFSAGNQGQNAENEKWLRDRVLEKLYACDENGKCSKEPDRRVHTDAFANYKAYTKRLEEYTNSREAALAQSRGTQIEQEENLRNAILKRALAEAALAELTPDPESRPDSVAEAQAYYEAVKSFIPPGEVGAAARAAAMAAGGDLGEIAARMDEAISAAMAAQEAYDAESAKPTTATGDPLAHLAKLRRLQEETTRLKDLLSALIQGETKEAEQVLEASRHLFSAVKAEIDSLEQFLKEHVKNMESAQARLEADRVYQFALAYLEQARHAWEAGDPMKYPFAPTLPENYVSSILPRAALAHAELQDIYLVAVGVEPTGDAYKIAQASNGCGDTKDFCLSAPNQALVAGVDEDGVPTLKVSAGTSVASAFVSGAAAVIMSAWPELTAAEVSRLLRDTAIPLCYRDGSHRMGEEPCGTEPDDTYGHGLLDLDEATKPQGTDEERRIATPSGASELPISESVIVSSPAFGSAFAAGDAAVGMFDSYDRIFAYPLAALMSDNADQARDSFGLFAEDYLRGADETAVGGGFAARIGDNGALLAASYQLEAGDWQTAFSYAGRDCESRAAASGGMHFAGGAEPTAPCRDRRTIHNFGAMFDDFADAELFALTERSAAAQTAVNIGGGIAAFSVAERRDAASDARYLRGAAKFAKRFGAAQLAAEIGHIAERDTVLGARFSGGLGMEGGGSTAYGRIAGLVDLADGWRGYGSLIAGRTRAAPLADGAIADISTIKSRGFHFGVGKSRVFYAGDSIRLDISRPLAVTDGELVIDGRDPANPHEDAQSRIDLAGDSYSRAALFYRRESASGLGTAWGVEHIFNSPARDYQGDETVISAAVSYGF